MQIDPRIERILLTEAQIEEGIQRAADYINQRYQNNHKPILLLGILKGCLPFLGRILNKINVDLEVDFMSASSYLGGHTSTEVVQIVTDIQTDVKDRDIAIIEDIIDTAHTLHTITKILKDRGARSVSLITLLDKEGQRKIELQVDFACFKIEPVFVVGFGLDYAEKFRNLPYIGVLKKEVYFYKLVQLSINSSGVLGCSS